MSTTHAFDYHGKRNAELRCDKVSLAQLAKQFGTPLYVYSGTQILERFRLFDQAFAAHAHTICYAVKANSNLSILRLLAKQGSGFDVVSGGELERVLAADKKAATRTVFSGVGKSAAEMDLALKAGILVFNVESEGELDLLAERAAKLRKRARIALRVNPDVFAETHPYISTGLSEHKFGIDIKIAPRIYQAAAKQRYLDPAAVSVHIGSQITNVQPFRDAMARVVGLVKQLAGDGIHIRYIDAGGGLGISYKRAEELDAAHRVSLYAEALRASLGDLDIHLLLEPGRFLIGNAGALLARVVFTKQNGAKRFVIVDAAMNDLIRPTLYGAHHEILPVRQPKHDTTTKADVVGPVCESGDFFARDRELAHLNDGDLVAILDAGAYGMSLASNYNTRPRPAEVLVQGSKVKRIRKRENFEDMVRGER